MDLQSPLTADGVSVGASWRVIRIMISDWTLYNGESVAFSGIIVPITGATTSLSAGYEYQKLMSTAQHRAVCRAGTPMAAK